MKVFKMVKLNFNEIELKELNSLLRYSEFYIKDNIKEYTNSLDKSGVLAEFFGDKMSLVTKTTIASQAAFAGIVAGALKASDTINKIQKATGAGSNLQQEYYNRFKDRQ